MSNYVLRYCQGEGEWQEIPLTHTTTIIGRGETCDLILADKQVSRQHASIQQEQGALWLSDLDATNPAVLDGTALKNRARVALRPGQTIEIGNYTISVEPSQAAATEVIQRSSPFTLRWRKGSGAWQDVPLAPGSLTIGRGKESDLQVSDQKASRQHIQLTLENNAVHVTDLGSTNGTLLDGNPIPPRRAVPLSPGQKVTIGEHDFVIEMMGAYPQKQPAGEHTMVSASHKPAEDAGKSGALETLIGGMDDLGIDTELRVMNLKTLEKVTIGRAEDNNIVLRHPMVSRYHAVIEKMGSRYRVRDLKSANGIFINGKRIEREAYLKDGDRIRLGASSFVLTRDMLQAKETSGLDLHALGLKQYVTKTLNILQDINLTIKPMEFVALVGMSGAGKTTLLNALSGYKPASHGRMVCDGVDLYENYDLFRNDIGYVPQKDIVHMELTPQMALEYAARLRMPPDTSKQERERVVSEVLTDLDLTERKDVPISRLSGGQLKRVSIGVELLTKPRLFFLDEPTSGLDPGTEFDMMKLMRRLADQGRTIILITHATKNVMFCDKVIFMARGGNLAFFGPPEDALEYFDQHRTEQERREKEMEFDDIYRILNDPARGAPEAWAERFKQTSHYRSIFTEREQSVADKAKKAAARPPRRKVRVSGLRQFMILSARNLKIIQQDKVSLALMLAIAPGLGLLEFIWGRELFDPVKGDASKIITMFFMLSLMTILVGSLSSIREIVKESDIYKRERAVNLKVAPYVMSKVWVGVVLALYQAVVLLLFVEFFVNPRILGAGGYVAMYITLFLATLCGYIIGLAISAAAPNQNAAMMLIIAALVPQFLFAGALLPLDLIPGGKEASVIMPTRWGFEAFMLITEIGDPLVEDACWDLPKAERKQLTEAEKTDCTCLGSNIFESCTEFPGILAKDFYSIEAAVALAQDEPLEPAQPTAIPYPTAFPSPTPLPSPTPFPSPTPLPTPADPREFGLYLQQSQEQGQAYQEQIFGQFDEYREWSKEQGQAYGDQLSAQGDEYADLRQVQGDQYADAMRDYGDVRADWQERREKAISNAEGILGGIYDNFGQAIEGNLASRWVYISLIMVGLLGIVLFFQRRKDVVG